MIAIHDKHLLQNWSKEKVSTPIVYKSIMLPAKLQEKIKLLATKKKQTIIEFISDLLKVL